MGHPYPAFTAYLSSPDTRSAPQWQIDTLAGVRFDGFEPTVELYKELRRALDAPRRASMVVPGPVAALPRERSPAA